MFLHDYYVAGRWRNLTFMRHTFLVVTVNQTVNDGVAHSKIPKKCACHVTFDLDLDFEHTLDAR